MKGRKQQDSEGQKVKGSNPELAKIFALKISSKVHLINPVLILQKPNTDSCIKGLVNNESNFSEWFGFIKLQKQQGDTLYFILTLLLGWNYHLGTPGIPRVSY